MVTGIRHLFAGGLAAFGLSVTAFAQGDTAPDQDFVAMATAELTTIVNTYIETGSQQQACFLGVPALEEFARRMPTHSQAKYHLLRSRMSCANEQGEFLAVNAYLDQAESEGVIYDPLFGLYLARMTNDPQMVLRRLRYLGVDSLMVLENRVSQQNSMVGEALRFTSQHGLEDEVSAIAAETFLLDRFAIFSDQVKTGFAVRALPVVMTEEPDRIADLLSYLEHPNSFTPLLLLREYEPIWPQLEERIGLGYSGATDEYSSQMASKFAESPSTETLNDYAQALAMDGQHEQAIAALQQWRTETAGNSEIDEQLAWAMNQAAFSLDLLSQFGEADIIMDQLAELDPESHPWIVSFVINRSGRFAMQERWDETLAATELAGSVAGELGSPYARLLISRDRACALEAVGRRQEAIDELERIRENGEADYSVVASGLMCLGFRMEAEELILTELRDEDKRRAVIIEMQDERLSVPYLRSALPHIRDMLDSNEEIRRLFLEYGRKMPEQYLPNSSR